MIEKVISGGQTGVDQAGLRAAKTAGIPTGGFMPMGYRTLDGFAPWMESEFNMVAIDTPSYAERTRLNVMQSDCTIRIAFDFGSAGERCTYNAIRRYGKPYVDFSPRTLTVEGTNQLVNWLLENKFKIVNIAGNSERTYKGIGDLAYKFLVPVFERVQFAGEKVQIIEKFNSDGFTETVLGFCTHGINLDREFCKEGCRV